MLQAYLNKNKYRQGYSKLIATLDSCVSWEQFCAWDVMANNFFGNINVQIYKLKRYTKFRFWYKAELNSWLEEIEIMLDDLRTRRDIFIANYQNNQSQKQTPVIRGFRTEEYD